MAIGSLPLPLRIASRIFAGSRSCHTCGGAPAYVWPGGGITVMVDVARMPDRSTGYVPTPALVFPIEFTMRLEDYRLMGGHVKHIVPVEQVLADQRKKAVAPHAENPWPMNLPDGGAR